MLSGLGPMNESAIRVTPTPSSHSVYQRIQACKMVVLRAWCEDVDMQNWKDKLAGLIG